MALGLALGILFAAYPLLDLEVADWFFDREAGRFPLSIDYSWNLVRRMANWVPFLLVMPPLFAVLRKVAFPNAPMAMAPSVVLFLIGSFLIGPGLTSNLLLKENWGRPRPNSVQQFAGSANFQPWWHPSDACKRNCSFVSGEASQAFWTVAPASLTPPQVRPLALGGAVLFGATVGALRVVFGRHFVTDIVFAGVVTILIVVALYRLLIHPARRNDAMIERGLERFSVMLHRGTGALLAGAGAVLAHAGSTLKETGQNLHNRVA
jgi:membrane-associated PAP2 superfamily phosphatase